MFQGLTVREIRQLEITDVRLEEGMLYVRGGRSYNGRRLKLDAAQVRQLEHCVRAHGKLSKPAMRGMRLLNGHYLREEVSKLLKVLKTLNPCDQERAADQGQRDYGVVASLQCAAGAIYGRPQIREQHTALPAHRAGRSQAHS